MKKLTRLTFASAEDARARMQGLLEERIAKNHAYRKAYAEVVEARERAGNALLAARDAQWASEQAYHAAEGFCSHLHEVNDFSEPFDCWCNEVATVGTRCAAHAEETAVGAEVLRGDVA